jgi:4-amino-4-deoxy-L-arabinose transferase-like glycosyltransferase
MVIKRYPLWFSLAIYWTITLVLLFSALTTTGKHFIYPLDDTYIHMAMARHLVFDGFMGVSHMGFSSSTSAPLWTFVIAGAYAVVGVREWVPLALNLLLGSVVIAACYSFLQRHTRPLHLTILIVTFTLLSLLPTMTLLGMEHTLHVLLTLCFTLLASRHLSEEKPSRGSLVRLALVAAILTLTRYEGVFLVGATALLFVIKRRLVSAMLIGAVGASSILLFGLYSVAQGWYLIPNSVLLKGHMVDATLTGLMQYVFTIPSQLVYNPHLLMLLIAITLLYRQRRRQGVATERDRHLATLFWLISLLHLQFSKTGYYYRYDMYLVALGIIIMFMMARSLVLPGAVSEGRGGLLRTAPGVILTLLLGLTLLVRAGHAFLQYPAAVANTYQQQYQMGLFLQRYYTGETVAANDIGAINYLADIKTLDLVGLASIDIARARFKGVYTWQTISRLSYDHNVKMAIVYDSWLGDLIPPSWVKVGQWRITNNVVQGSDVVSFYGVNEASSEALATHLREFAPHLPLGVDQAGAYMTNR